MLTKNQIYDMRCEGFGADAAGVCRQEGMAVFVPGLLPGETASVRIVKVQKRYAFGRIEALLSPSSDRVTPPCPANKRCGGCSCQHMRYEASLEFKRNQVQELFRRVGGLDITLPPVIGMDDPWHYRNKGTYPVADTANGPVCGFFAPRSHELVPLPQEGCRIQRPESSAAVAALLAWMRQYSVPAFNEVTGQGLVRHLMTRTSSDGATVATLICSRRKLPHEEALIAGLRQAVPPLSGLCLIENPRRDNVILDGRLHCIWGSPLLQMTLCGLHFSVAPQAFFQVNPVQTEKLYALALSFAELTGQENVIDAYCGAGTISLLLAQHAAHVTGIEIVPQAIENAKENARANSVRNADFLCGATEVLLPQLVKDGLRPDVVVLDPPRKGCNPAVLSAIAQVKPERIVYVSCGAPALARDAKILCAAGYQVERAQCVDMFCWTGDVETVVCLSNKNARSKDYIEIGLDVEDYYRIKDSAGADKCGGAEEDE